MPLTFSVTRAGFTMQAIVTRQSQDLLIQLIGGDVPHYGVVTTVSQQEAPATIAMPSRPGHHHQEGVLTEQLATQLRPNLQSNAMIIGGMHVNEITPAQMQATQGMVTDLGDQILAWLADHPAAKPVERFSK
ncbi:hypothetical protein [Secundilactobacillus collinoides]|uniref:Prenylated flavin chaperone LpdD-like domain-containing protein n=2 Tax=Secundilactobacillus collinoides TaxID=33960 RepID=A0A0R2B9S5_SECCO|nr:hypothetical protein [Secundilactobacillus collinoides]KRM75911.1 hypothetical protein FC82_GL002066 [Secundilactobacillus collinoides DSM 20515 = JCM 1123]KZL37116.1 hypothetical protein TY91_12800 [Secundilactobacillus collinoides]